MRHKRLHGRAVSGAGDRAANCARDQARPAGFNARNVYIRMCSASSLEGRIHSLLQDSVELVIVLIDRVCF